MSACGTGKNCLVHAAHGAAHGVVTCRLALVVLSWAGACLAGVVVVHIATMRAAVVPVFETLDRCGGVAGGGTVFTTVCAAATVVAAAAAAVCVLVATIVATATAICGLLVATVVVSTTTVVASASVAATTTVVAAALLSALLVVDDTRGGLAIAEGLAEHLELPLDRVDVGRVGSE